ncbi:MAG: DUF421 domain-containing protein [Dethiobacter sp.]|jgi:uncharacterized membrane protein YcaP (DUF421 family)|nr:MAG: DUF421 domain-containing protein [Dethiobacter sp.]
MSFWEQIFLSTPELHILGFLVRGIFAFIFLMIVVRLMGPVEIGEITAIDFVVAITIGSIAAAALVDSEVHFGSSLLNMGLWAFLSISLNLAGIRFPNVRRILVGGPLVLIKNGKIQEKNLFRAKLNFDDLMSALRLQGVALLEDVEFAVLEPRGEISVIKKSQKQSITPEDLKMVVQHQGFPSVVVLHGKIMQRNLHHRGYTENWLKDKLNEMGVEDPETVSLAQLDTNGKLYVDLYDDKQPRPQSTREKELVIKLEKINAQLESFALETENKEMKNIYQEYAEHTVKILSALKPIILKAEEIQD